MELSRVFRMVKATVTGDNSMKVDISHKNLPIGEIGILNLEIPIVQIGNGKHPHLGILCGVHGDETASLFISYQLVERLSSEKLYGTVSIITAANPFAQSTNSRVSLIDFYDLNRTGAGKSDGTLTERVAYKIIDFVLGNCSHVIDLHEFEMDTPLMAIYIPSQDETVNAQILRMIGVFKPDTVWSMDLSSPDEVRYAGSLLSVLIGKGIPGFAVETSRLCVVSQQDIEKVVNGILEVSRLAGVIQGEYRYAHPVAYKRNVKHSDYAGIWIPEKAIMSQVHAGDKVGTIIGLDLVSQRDIFASDNGTLIQMRRVELVQTGINLFTIGEVDTFASENFKLIAP